MNRISAKDKILDVATQVFAEKSFEGARIDEIAKVAGIPKSLIYYHFKSKEEIFEVLLERFVSDYMEILKNAHVENQKQEHEKEELGISDRLEKIYYEFGKKNADIVRLIFIDALKKKGGNTVFFKIIDLITQIDSSENNHLLQERCVAEFFTSFLPCCTYICFADQFMDYFHIERNTFDRLFLKIYEETHGAYHQKLSQGSVEKVKEGEE